MKVHVCEAVFMWTVNSLSIKIGMPISKAKAIDPSAALQNESKVKLSRVCIEATLDKKRPARFRVNWRLKGGPRADAIAKRPINILSDML